MGKLAFNTPTREYTAGVKAFTGLLTGIAQKNRLSPDFQAAARPTLDAFLSYINAPTPGTNSKIIWPAVGKPYRSDISKLRSALASAADYIYRSPGAKQDFLDAVLTFSNTNIVQINRNAVIAFIGDSTIAGQRAGGGTQQAPTSVTAQLADQLNAAGYNATDDNWFADRGCFGQTQSFANYIACDARVSGTATLSSAEVTGGNIFAITSLPGNIRFQGKQAGDTLKFWWNDNDIAANKAFDVVYGGKTTRVTGTGLGAIREIVIKADYYGVHSVNFVGVTGSLGLFGVMLYDSTLPQIKLMNWGISGGGSFTLTSNTPSPVGRFDLYRYYNPDLTLIQSGIINDIRAGTPLATSETRLLSLIANSKLTQNGTGKVITATPLPDNATGGASAIAEQYGDMVRRVSVAQNVGCVDWRALFRSWAYANAQGWESDSVHPSTPGYGRMASWLLNSLFITG